MRVMSWPGNVVEIYAARHLRWLETRTPTRQVRDSRVGSASWSTARVLLALGLIMRNDAQLLIPRWDALTLSLAADGSGQRLADRAHRRGSCATHPTHEAGPSDELHVVKVCYGFDAHSVLRPYADLGGQTANG